MDKKKLLLLVGALLIAAVTAFMARSMFLGASAPKADAQSVEPQGPRVLVAKRALPVGTILTIDSMAYQPWPKELVQDAYFLEDASDTAKLVGTVVRNTITAGQPLTKGSLVHPGDRGFLAAALGPGMRAVTLPVSARTGVGGFIFPGDRVDLVLTQSIEDPTGNGAALKASETIIRNLRVLATDQNSESSMVDGKTVVKKFKTVTVEATPRFAEKIAVAQTIGTLSLSLRSIADNEAELERAIAAGEVNIPAGATPEEEEKILRAAISRPMDGDVTFVTGGDVSRFQRRSMPVAAPKPTMPSFAAPRPMVDAPRPRAAAATPQMPQAPKGPVVRVTRGKTVTEVTIGDN